ncbi:hypothetical protein SDJN03_09628, partial [Cucurbita argyrosperma subsp. sororia]
MRDLKKAEGEETGNQSVKRRIERTIGNLELRSIRRRQISSLHAEVTAEETAEAGKARQGGAEIRRDFDITFKLCEEYLIQS